ncbi:helix-turn-helix domain-containing protein [Streptomyces sp. NPDC000594]|uniref:helix-turn-helix domain-containing protein n=1 Tax=Streptomyces sp. NPDC000594 TaxID=3154261 RepID=UPI003330D003
MSDAGRHVKDVRKRRGLTQRGLADASGVSLSIIRKLEQGERETVRLETLRKLAAALRVPTMRLSGGPNEEGPREGTKERWESLRSALEQPPRMPQSDDDQPTVAGVRDALSATEPMFRKDEFAKLALALPSLLQDAEALGDAGRELRVRLLELSGWLMVQTRQFDVAETALQRAMSEASDRLEGAAVMNTWSWLLMRQGELEKAHDLAVKWADETEPRITRATPEELSAWGIMLLRVSGSAIRNAHPGVAQNALRFANSAAAALGREYTPRNIGRSSTFGPTRVRLHAAENASVMDQPDLVLRIARKISVRSQGSNNRNRHFLDVADAYAKTGMYMEAFGQLEQIRASSPEWLPNQRYARDIFARIAKGRRTLTSEMRAMADVVGMPL